VRKAFLGPRASSCP